MMAMADGNILSRGFGAEDPGFLLADGYGDFWLWSSVPAMADAGRTLTRGFGSSNEAYLLTGGFGEFEHDLGDAGRLLTRGLGSNGAYLLTDGYGDFSGPGTAPPAGASIGHIHGMNLLDRFRWWR